MYAIGQHVWCKSQNVVARVSEANYRTAPIGGKRRAVYLVEWWEGHRDPMTHRDFLTGSDDLRAADGCCDGCSRWLPAGSFVGGAWGRDGEYEQGLRFCFLCTQEAARADHRPDAYYRMGEV